VATVTAGSVVDQGSSGPNADYFKYLKKIDKTFASVAPSGTHIGLVEKDGGLLITVWDEAWNVYSGFYTAQSLESRWNDCMSWKPFFITLSQVSRGIFQDGSLCLQRKGGKTLTFPLQFVFGHQPLINGILIPLVQTYIKLKNAPDDAQYTTAEIDKMKLLMSCSNAEHQVASLKSELIPLEQDVQHARDDACAASEQVDGLAKQINKLKFVLSSQKEDLLYTDIVQPFGLHCPEAKIFVPRSVPVDPGALHALRVKYGVGSSSKPAVMQDKENMMDTSAILLQLGRIDSWDYNCFNLEKASKGCPLFFTCYDLLHRYGLVTHYKMDDAILCNFLSALESGYHPNNYHNNIHAADVLQITHYIMEHGGLKPTIFMQSNEIMASILAAAIHDYDHPGLNNNFHIKTRSYLATLYNDQSVLENHHVASIYQLVKNPKYNIFHAMSWEQYKDIRDCVTEMVLATDMGLHAKICHAFKDRLAESKPLHSKEDQRLALSIVLKMADISNCCRPLPLYKKWARCIVEEFYCQGEAERQRALPVSPFMDRNKHVTDFAKGQVSFMNYIVIPSIELGVEMLPKMSFAVEQCYHNKDTLFTTQVDI